MSESNKHKPRTSEDWIEAFIADVQLIYDERSSVYDNKGIPTWDRMSVDSILSGVIYRADRARGTENLNKKYDDIKDAYNYLKFAGAKMKRLLEKNKIGTH